MSRALSQKRPKTAARSVEAPLAKPSRCERFLPWILIALVILSIAAIRIRLLGTPLERDEGEYAYSGQLMLQGVPPYQLAFNMKFPGTYAAYAAIMAVFGQTIAGIHLGFLLVNAGTILLVFLLGKKLFTGAAGVAAGAAYGLLSIGAGVMGSQAHATHFVVAAAVGGTLLLLRAIEAERWSMFFLSGTLYGVAVLMKQHGALFAVFAGSYLIWNHWAQRRTAWLGLVKNLGLLALGTFLPLLVTGLALWRAGVFAKFWFWTITYAREYASEVPLSGAIGMFTSAFPGIVGPNLAIWFVAASGLVLVWWKNQHRSKAIFVTGFLAFSFLAVCPGFYFREHYFVLMLPAVALLAGAAVSSGVKRFPAARLLIYGLFGAALALAVALQRDFLFERSLLEISRTMYGANPFPEAIQIADYIRNHSEPSARIAVLGSEPEIPFYANRRSATGYIYTYGLMETQPYALTMQNEMLHDLETAHPEYVVMVGIPTSWLRQPDSPSRIFDWWTQYGPTHYKVVGVADIVSADHTEYRWDDAAITYQPKSNFIVAVYQRTQ